MRIVADFEPSHQVGFQAMRVPDPANTGRAHPGGCRHRSRTPVSCVIRLLARGHVHHLFHPSRRSIRDDEARNQQAATEAIEREREHTKSLEFWIQRLNVPCAASSGLAIFAWFRYGHTTTSARSSSSARG